MIKYIYLVIDSLPFEHKSGSFVLTSKASGLMAHPWPDSNGSSIVTSFVQQMLGTDKEEKWEGILDEKSYLMWILSLAQSLLWKYQLEELGNQLRRLVPVPQQKQRSLIWTVTLLNRWGMENNGPVSESWWWDQDGYRGTSALGCSGRAWKTLENPWKSSICVMQTVHDELCRRVLVLTGCDIYLEIHVCSIAHPQTH